MPVNCPLCHKPIDFDKKKIGWFEPDETEWSIMTDDQRKPFNPLIGAAAMVHVDCATKLTERANNSSISSKNEVKDDE